MEVTAHLDEKITVHDIPLEIGSAAPDGSSYDRNRSGQQPQPEAVRPRPEAGPWSALTLKEAVAVSDEVVARFCNDPEPAVRKQVAGALGDKGFTLLLSNGSTRRPPLTPTSTGPGVDDLSDS